jgi:hypothetical protein
MYNLTLFSFTIINMYSLKPRKSTYKGSRGFRFILKIWDATPRYAISIHLFLSKRLFTPATAATAGLGLLSDGLEIVIFLAATGTPTGSASAFRHEKCFWPRWELLPIGKRLLCIQMKVKKSRAVIVRAMVLWGEESRSVYCIVLHSDGSACSTQQRQHLIMYANVSGVGSD